MTGSRPSAPGEPAAALVASEGNNSRPTRPARALTNFSALSSDALLLGIKGERPDDKHPLHKLLIQTTEDLEAARDRYRGLLKECEDIKEDLRSRFQKRAERNDRASAFDLPELDNVLDEVDDYYFDLPQSAYLAYVDKVDLDFLLRYGDTIASAEAVIHAQEEHVARLQKTCRQMSILPDSISQDEEDDGSGENYELPGVDELADISSKTASDVSSFPILLSNPLFAAKQYPLTAREAVQKMLALPESDPKRQALIDDSVKEYGILSSLMRSAQGNKSDFINRWILQQLRMSPMAAVQLYSIFSGVLRIVNVSRWQEDVLHFWARDGTNLPDYYYRGPMTGLSSSFLSAMSTSSAFPDIQSLHNGVTDAINA
ncbi:hypothetical protein SEUCBS139899_005263 [Sporothrix eucalyptigena]|uniref:Uncharacterized protein n=1 Tax=Sporothrix eucalyptigena TaxID=1812306 RepID=A0ABP0BQZ6_9PEZI